MTETTEAKRIVPDPFRTTIDQVCAEDAAWFKAHPGKTGRTRRARAGEFWPLLEPLPPAQLAGVRVALVGPGQRIRQPMLSGLKPGQSLRWLLYTEPQPSPQGEH